MRAQARVDFGLSDAEFWELSHDEWNEFCHVGNRAMLLIDKQFAETRHLIYNMLSASNSPNKSTADFRMLRDPAEPDPDDFLDAFSMLL